MPYDLGTVPNFQSNSNKVYQDIYNANNPSYKFGGPQNLGTVPNFQANKAYSDIYGANASTINGSQVGGYIGGGNFSLPNPSAMSAAPSAGGMPAAGGMQFLPPALQTSYGIYFLC